MLLYNSSKMDTNTVIHSHVQTYQTLILFIIEVVSLIQVSS